MNDPGTRAASQRLSKRSVVIAGHRTSLSLEEAFWQVLKAIAAERGLAVARLIEEIDRSRSGNLSSAARLFVLEALLRNSQG
jgi:predicted DNA-binding ribbon-helix-helix protein